jgi:hypothetical protein
MRRASMSQSNGACLHLYFISAAAQLGSRFAGNRAPVQKPRCTFLFMVVISHYRCGHIFLRNLT